MPYRLILLFFVCLFSNTALAASDQPQPVSTQLSYSLEGVKNVSGGLRKGSALLGAGLLDVTIDSESNGWWKGGTLFIEALLNHGRDPSVFIGDTQTASNIADGNRTRLQQFWYEHQGPGISVLIGLHDLNSEFYVSEYASLFLNSSFGIGPDISANAPAVSLWPQAGWAIRIALQLNDNISLRGAIYDGDPTTRAIAANEGKMNIVELAWTEEEQAYKLGVWRHSGKKTAPDGRTFASDSGLYGVIDQPLATWGDRALGAFLQLGLAQKDRNDISNYVGVGFNLSAPIAGRNDDLLGIALARAGFSNSYQRINSSSSAETTIELTYHAQITSLFELHPAIQWIQHPGGDPALAAARVAMLRASFSFF